MLDQSAGQRQLRHDHRRATVHVGIGAVAGDDVAKVLLIAERQGREFVQGIAMSCLRPIGYAGDLVTVTSACAICRLPYGTGVQGGVQSCRVRG